MGGRLSGVDVKGVTDRLGLADVSGGHSLPNSHPHSPSLHSGHLNAPESTLLQGCPSDMHLQQTPATPSVEDARDARFPLLLMWLFNHDLNSKRLLATTIFETVLPV